LQRMGIDLHTAAGEMKPTSDILIEISEGLNKLPEGLQRDAAAMDLFKRVGIEAIPFMTELNPQPPHRARGGLRADRGGCAPVPGIPARSVGARNEVGRAGAQVQRGIGHHRVLRG